MPEPIPTAPTNTPCASAATINSSVSCIALDVSVGTAATACGTSGKNLYYSVFVPSGFQLVATLTPTPAFDAKIRLYPACGSAVCTAQADAQLTTTTPEVLTWINVGADATMILAAGTFSATTGTLTADLRIDINPPPPNRYCSMPTPIAKGTVWPNLYPSLANTTRR